MAFFLIIISISLGMAGLLWNTPLSFFLHWEGKEIRLHVSLRTFFGLVPIGMDMAVQYFPLRLYLGRRQLSLGKRHTGRRSWKGLGKALASQRAAWFALDRLRLLGKVGKLGDAYRSVLYAGALHIGADCLFQVLFQPDALEIQVAPIWDCRCFWVKLEGIGTLRPWQIIGIAIGHQIRRSRRGKKIWHTPSKTL